MIQDATESVHAAKKMTRITRLCIAVYDESATELDDELYESLKQEKELTLCFHAGRRVHFPRLISRLLNIRIIISDNAIFGDEAKQRKIRCYNACGVARLCFRKMNMHKDVIGVIIKMILETQYDPCWFIHTYKTQVCYGVSNKK